MPIDMIPEPYRAMFASIALAVFLVTPVARALMAMAHGLRDMALKTTSKTDDAIAMKIVFATESFCGFVTKLSRFLPRVTMSEVKR